MSIIRLWKGSNVEKETPHTNLFKMHLRTCLWGRLCLFQEARESAVWMKIHFVSHEARTRQDLHSVLTSGSLALLKKEKGARNRLQSRTEGSYNYWRRLASPDMRDAGTMPHRLLWLISILGMKRAWKVGDFLMGQIQSNMLFWEAN